MPIEYEMKYLKEMTEDAIRNYSEETYSASWMQNVEYEILEKFQNSTNLPEIFREYQILAMRELIRRGYWVKWRDGEQGRNSVILYKFTQNKEGAD